MEDNGFNVTLSVITAKWGISMTKYLNHAEYNRWYRSYMLTLERFVAHLDNLRIELDDLPGKEEIDKGLNDLDEKLEEAVPRNFNFESAPLTTSEVFRENLKVIVNLMYGLFRLEQPFISIYQIERDRVLDKHHHYKYKERYAELKIKADVILTEQRRKERELLLEELKRAKENMSL